MRPTIIVELIKQAGLRRFPGRKPEQPWRWIVKDAGNNEPFERPTERYLEERGALSAIEQVHGPDALVILRREGQRDRILREPASRRVELTPDELTVVADMLWAAEFPPVPDSPATVRAYLVLAIDEINRVVAP